MILYHGSPVIVERPVFGVGNPYNDYGTGFYCTASKDLACEWACPRDIDGFANAYELDEAGLTFYDLNECSSGVLGWLAVLLTYRQFDIPFAAMRQARDFILSLYPTEVDESDVVVGYRADDSYFSFARAFLDNRITLRQLERAMRLGELGNQIVLKSQQAFESISFLNAQPALAEEWHERRMERDEKARSTFRQMTSEEEILPEDVFVADLIRRA